MNAWLRVASPHGRRQRPRHRLLHHQLLRDGVPEATPRTAEAREAIVAAYLRGERTFEGAATPLRAALADVDVADALVRAKAIEGRSWVEAAELAGQPSVPAAMRALRRALAALLTG